jgi:UDP-N-acetylglucosamine--N-acetylmuramyl-(pentapeptide) pyrophosphoryl-undecaprenol N-acetylglucosamine transferase
MKSSESVRLIFAGGGTGGHLYPALAIADHLKKLIGSTHKLESHFVGTRKGIEFRLQETIGYPLHLIQMQGIARALTPRNLLVPFIVTMGLLQSMRLMKQISPHLVVGTGGYVSWPVLKAANVRRIPTVIQEQNSFPGIATRRLAADAQAVYLGFDDARKHLTSDANCVLTGNPVRNGLSGADRNEAMRVFNLDPTKKTILVFGGSQGAHAINEAVLAGLLAGRLVGQVPKNYQLLWLTGKRDYTEVNARAGDMAASHALFPYEHRMNLAYAAADVAVARAGALTLAELEMCGVPAILVPFPHAAGDHQRKNAASFAALGFAEVIDETKLGETHILNRAIALIESGRADQMRLAMSGFRSGRPAAVDLIAGDILNRLGIETSTMPRHFQEHHDNS